MPNGAVDGAVDAVVRLESLATATALLVAGYNVSQSTVRNPSSYSNKTNTTFPIDLYKQSAGRNHTLTLFFYEYSRPSVNVPVFKNPVGSITLPLPNRLIDAQTMGYSTQNNSALVGAALDAATKAGGLQQTFSSASSISNLFSSIGKAISTQAAANVTDLLGQAAGQKNGAAVVGQVFGLAQNPYLTVLFDAPAFKRHQFIWTFTPVNKSESDILKYIINKLRYHQLADIGSGTAGNLLQYPDMCVPVINPDGYVYSFKNCVIESAQVNFAPGANPGFQASGAPVTIEISLSLLEIEIWLKSDINSGSGSYDNQGALSNNYNTNQNIIPLGQS